MLTCESCLAWHCMLYAFEVGGELPCDVPVHQSFYFDIIYGNILGGGGVGEEG
jgi:hypothetical protein